MRDAINSVFWCPQCGEGVTADEDDCCGSCGAMLVTETVLSAIAAAARAQGAEEERRECAAVCERVALGWNSAGELHRAWGAEACLTAICSRTSAQPAAGKGGGE